MRNCHFEDNQAPRKGGGAISLADFSSLQINKGTFYNNQGKGGGAILTSDDSSLILEDSGFA